MSIVVRYDEGIQYRFRVWFLLGVFVSFSEWCISVDAAAGTEAVAIAADASVRAMMQQNSGGDEDDVLLTQVDRSEHAGLGGYAEAVGVYDAGWNHMVQKHLTEIKILTTLYAQNFTDLYGAQDTNRANIDLNEAAIKRNMVTISSALSELNTIAGNIITHSADVANQKHALTAALDVARKKLKEGISGTAAERKRLLNEVRGLKQDIEKYSTENQTTIVESKIEEEMRALKKTILEEELTSKVDSNRANIIEGQNKISEKLKTLHENLIAGVGSPAGRKELYTDMSQMQKDIRAAIEGNAALRLRNRQLISENRAAIDRSNTNYQENKRDLDTHKQLLEELEAKKKKEIEALDDLIKKNLQAIADNTGMRADELENRNKEIEEADQNLNTLREKYKKEIEALTSRIKAEEGKLENRKKTASTGREGLIKEVASLNARIYRLKRWKCGKCASTNTLFLQASSRKTNAFLSLPQTQHMGGEEDV